MASIFYTSVSFRPPDIFVMNQLEDKRWFNPQACTPQQVWERLQNTPPGTFAIAKSNPVGSSVQYDLIYKRIGTNRLELIPLQKVVAQLSDGNTLGTLEQILKTYHCTLPYFQSYPTSFTLFSLEDAFKNLEMAPTGTYALCNDE